MSPRRRAALKRLVLALVVLAVCGFPFITLKAFLYLVGGLVLAAGMFATGMALDFWKGFRAFERWTEDEFNRLTGRAPAARPRAVLPRGWR
jgi:hypothetical protein